MSHAGIMSLRAVTVLVSWWTMSVMDYLIVLTHQMKPPVVGNV